MRKHLALMLLLLASCALFGLGGSEEDEFIQDPVPAVLDSITREDITPTPMPEPAQTTPAVAPVTPVEQEPTGESDVDALRRKDIFQGSSLPPEIKVVLLAMLPIFELRGSIPIGYWVYEIPWYHVVWLSILGNMIPIFLILVLIDVIARFMWKFPGGKRFLEKIFARTRAKGGVIQKYKELGLILFVAIPLPMTGGWTGALAAYVFGLNYMKSLLCIFIGVLIAGIVVTIFTLLGWLGAILAFVGFSILLVFQYLNSRR